MPASRGDCKAGKAGTWSSQAVWPAVVPGVVTAQVTHVQVTAGKEKNSQEIEGNGSVSPCSFVAQLCSW